LDTLQGALTTFRGVERRLKKDPNLHLILNLILSSVYEILTFAFLIYFCAASHFRGFVGLSVKTTTGSIGHTRQM